MSSPATTITMSSPVTTITVDVDEVNALYAAADIYEAVLEHLPVRSPALALQLEALRRARPSLVSAGRRLAAAREDAVAAIRSRS